MAAVTDIMTSICRNRVNMIGIMSQWHFETIYVLENLAKGGPQTSFLAGFRMTLIRLWTLHQVPSVKVKTFFWLKHLQPIGKVSIPTLSKLLCYFRPKSFVPRSPLGFNHAGFLTSTSTAKNYAMVGESREVFTKRAWLMKNILTVSYVKIRGKGACPSLHLLPIPRLSSVPSKAGCLTV